MENKGCIIKVPGKLMIAGEYAVLEPGSAAVVIAVNRYLTVDISPSLENELYLPQLLLEKITWNNEDKGTVFSIEDERLCFIKNAMDVVCMYLKEKGFMIHPFKLYIKSDLNDLVTGKKYGLGSSAAIVVGVISSVLSLHGEFKSRENLINIFKLSAIAHVKTQGNGSGADIAAAVYGGWLKYSTFSSKWLLKKIDKERSIINIVNMPWTDLRIEKLTPPKELKLLVGWTQESVGTASMVKKIQSFQADNVESYEEFLNESNYSVAILTNAFEEGDIKKALEALYNNRRALNKLGKLAGVNIETKKLETLCKIADRYGRGKTSGAGGGDCGIAFIEGEEEYLALCKEWMEVGIVPLDLLVAPTGCEISELRAGDDSLN